MRLAAGTHLGRYVIVGPLGKGGMGEVYRGLDETLNREIAIKVLAEQAADHAESQKRFLREAKAIAALSHPNILNIYDFGIDQGILYAVMELLQGETLRNEIAKGPLGWQRCAKIGAAVAEGLASAHSRGISHRDLKPENIFLTSEGGVKILDFGLAQIASAPPEQNLTKAETLSEVTGQGFLKGTIPYMSPEQLRGEPLDQSTDLFSFGCVLYEMITGNRAFPGATAADTISSILNREPGPLYSNGTEIPPELDFLIRTCLEKDKRQRPGSSQELARNLNAILKSSSIGGKTSVVPKSRRKMGIWIPLSVLVVIAILVGLNTRRIHEQFSGSDKNGAIQSLAILPLQNGTEDPEAEYFSDGVTESLINTLSRLPNLKVTARTTVFRYKDKDMDPILIGRELGVRAILTGEVVQRGNNLIIQADLVDVTDGTQLWGNQYHRKLSDILALQEEISNEISGKLRLKLSGEDQKLLAKRYTENTEAYQLYLKGRYHWNKRSFAGLMKAIEYFEQAIQKDPNYPLAYSGLADCYLVLSGRGLGALSPEDTMPKAKAAADKALELDDSLAEAHVARGSVTLLYDLDPQAAEIEIQKGIRLNRNYATAYFRYAMCLAALGRKDEAIEQIKISQDLEPLSPIINAAVAWMYHFSGDNDRAIEYSQKALELDPDSSIARFRLSIAYEGKGMYPEAIAECEKAASLTGRNAESLSVLAHIYAVSGRKKDALKILDELNQLSKHAYISAYAIAEIYVGLGETDRAFEWLRTACDERSWYFVFAKVEPRLDPLRSDPRFANLMRCAGF